jgi:hypothetical protein
MPSVGSHQGAERARQIFIDVGRKLYGNLPSETPDHWSLVGKGDHRLVYRAPTGEVYKVGRDRINRREHGVLQFLAAEPETVAFVPVYAFYDFSTAFDLTGWSMGETVVAMEFVENDGTEPDDHDLTILIDRLETLGVSDHSENWRVRNGRPVIIDCGGF